MSFPVILGFVQLVALLAGIFAGFPIAFTLIVLTVLFGYLGLGDRAFDLMVYQSWGVMGTETLAAVPLFVFMGYILEQAGIMERLFKGFQFTLARVPGALYIGVLLTSTIFATATGIIGASVTLIGMLAAPVMTKSNYDPALSAGTITAGGTLGILIPPSVMLVVLGPVVGVSIPKLFAACILPGLLITALFLVYVLVRCWINPKLGPPLPPEDRPANWRVAVRELIVGMTPMLLLIGATLGSILTGIATPTEGAGMGAAGALILTIFYGRFTMPRLRMALYQTVIVSSMILFLLLASNMFGAVFNRLGTGPWIANLLVSWDLPPFGVVVALMIVVFLLGWPLEWAPIVFIFLPIFLPIVNQAELDLLWISALVAVNLQTAFLSPPVAMAAYYLKAVAPQWHLKQIYSGMFQFVGLQVVALILLLAFPAIALWLPGVMFD
ncbi:C4-dicarboxylate ABC transporter [Salipiger aestuarii]|uniref:Tripartite ATP-independent transporter DctM subunit n=1 Tax=Salipiger aestuarii TaxID=568098 RepID=A0A327XM20_9RHOB|nr:TRAP transporter large permease subunit [Salipiger aestuarii]EIE50269.1 putative TRAP family transmembrane transporter protein [Citreicella sp. 357]KAA8605028.1 C4-dicarboxylate ABC transporter [Salipiger aestuarii]KAA8606428.1 C4-dicarboxylate ABC transporter [Salipiger aestuarii]KAB2532425.1 C4-dicarboxylate ABC transporter [Salipiger aestuarii]RAK09006.1 tripartite ATP-independent transporter DctM subunit [Salipiger aestuarii]